jgi:serine phosphatase RsbU (regulator of sigma subunit)
MSARSSFLYKLQKSRLSSRIIFWIFASIVTIETIILIPSVLRREREFLSQIKEVSVGKVYITARVTDQEMPEMTFLQELSKLPGNSLHLIGKLEHKIVGGALYQKNGKLIGTFGEKPELLLSDVQPDVQQNRRNLLKNGNRYDVALLDEELPDRYVIIIRHDISAVKPELQAFIFRITGLVAIISLFTTVGVWIALDPIVIRPILHLRDDLKLAGEAIHDDVEPLEFLSASFRRNDEMGEVIATFQIMFAQITQAIRDRKCAEVALQSSLQKVADYSEKLNTELEKGREIQKNFLPANILQHQGWEIATFFKPARQVAGDFYDVFELPCGRIGLVIADVCDKGVGAALFMALFRSLIRIFSGQTMLEGLKLSGHPQRDITFDRVNAQLKYSSSLDAVAFTNNYIVQNHGELGMFATLFFGVLEPETGMLTYINGGHEPLMVIHPEGGIKSYLKPTGPAVGIIPNSQFKMEQVQLEAGEILLGYTDGVPEARDRDSQFFTTARLLSVLEMKSGSAQTLLDTIANYTIAHTGEAEQFDDITLLAVRRTK